MKYNTALPYFSNEDIDIIIPQLKEIVIDDSYKNEFIIEHKEKKVLKIKRKKPIFNDSSILDTCMNIVYN